MSSHKLSREQRYAIRFALNRGEHLGLSAMTLLELANLVGERGRIKGSADQLLREIELNSDFELLPLDFDVAREVAALGPGLRDPADRVIVATARVHGLRLVTSDQGIIKSELVRVIE